MSAILTEIVNLLVGGFSSFATGLGSGIKNYIESLFVTIPTGTGTPTLTTFGSLVIIFAAISLTIGLSRWVLNFFTSLGQRNR